MTTTNTGAASLLPCPFCGGEAKSFEESLDERFPYANKITIRCSACDVSVDATGIIPHGGYADNSTTEKRAVEAWNRRATTPQADAAPSDPLRAAVESMVTMLEEGEWAEHASTFKAPGDALASRLESAITDLHNQHQSYQQFLDETADATRPYARNALISCIAECLALSYSEDRGITVSEAESIGGVLHELRRLQNLEAEAVAIVTRDAAIAAGGAREPAELRAIHDLLHTQDNRITAAPMFAVQQKRRVYGIDTDYDPKIVWVNEDSDEVDEERSAELEAAYQQDGDDRPGNYKRLGYHEYWEFVTACFTEQGCKDYLARNGHNLHETRTYAYGTYRNAEWQTVRDFLMSDRFAAAPAAASNGAPK